MSRLESALAAARDTKRLELGRGANAQLINIFTEQFGQREGITIADPNTFAAVAFGEHACDWPGEMRIVNDAQAEWKFVEKIEEELRKTDAIPVALGSGTINDLVKLAAHRVGRPYMCVATAASMDGYTAYGASITKDGSKQTFDCPAPRVVIADIDIIESAPPHLTAAGYADLLAKITAGADWIVADALGVEPIDAGVWETVQGGLRKAVAHPINIERLTEGLLMSGFAMQAHQTSRPASGAEHQFSHLWDMQHATDASHGFKVGVATLAVANLYETILELSLEGFNIDRAVAKWPARDEEERWIIELFDKAELRDKALLETRAKWVDRDTLRAQLIRLRDVWPDLKRHLRDYLLPASEISEMLKRARAPISSQEIGISPQQLHRSFRLAYHIRRRFTVLDLAERLGVLP